MQGILLALALRMLPKAILGISTPAIIAALPQIATAFKAITTVVTTLKAAGVDEHTAAKIAFDMVAKNKRDPSTLESEAWANRGLQSGQ